MRVTALDGRISLHNTLGQKYYKRRSDWHFGGKPQRELSLLRSILKSAAELFSAATNSEDHRENVSIISWRKD